MVTSDGNLTGIIEAQILAASVLNLQEAAGFFFRFLKGETLQSVSQAKKMWHYEKILGLNKSTIQPILDEKSILVQICHFPEVFPPTRPQELVNTNTPLALSNKEPALPLV